MNDEPTPERKGVSREEFEALLKKHGTRILPARPGRSHVIIPAPGHELDELPSDEPDSDPS